MRRQVFPRAFASPSGSPRVESYHLYVCTDPRKCPRIDTSNRLPVSTDDPRWLEPPTTEPHGGARGLPPPHAATATLHVPAHAISIAAYMGRPISATAGVATAGDTFVSQPTDAAAVPTPIPTIFPNLPTMATTRSTIDRQLARCSNDEGCLCTVT